MQEKYIGKGIATGVLWLCTTAVAFSNEPRLTVVFSMWAVIITFAVWRKEIFN